MICNVLARGLFTLLLAGSMICAAQADVFNMPNGLTDLNIVTVGDAGNASDTRYNPSGYGAVAQPYGMGQFEVTAGQYAQFLNATAASDTYGLYDPAMGDTSGSAVGCDIQRTGNPGSYSYSVASDWADRPVNFITWGNAARFCNWLTNGQRTGAEGPATTEDGSYSLNGATTNSALMAVTRKAGARYYIPNENEWYKAAYYVGGGTNAGYWTYPTKSNSPPSNTLITPDPGNHANFHDSTGGGSNTIDYPYYRTEAGDFEKSASAYGTYDQGGNVWEWNETATSTTSRGQRGGGFQTAANTLAASWRVGDNAVIDSDHVGFRVACVPELLPLDWKGAASTDWGAGANWSLNTVVPGIAGSKVSFGNELSSNNVVDMKTAARTVGSIAFSAGTSTTIQSTGGFSLTLDNNGSSSTISVLGTHFVNVPVILNNDLDFSGPGTLDLSGGISGDHTVNVISGNLTVKSIEAGGLSIGSGAIVTILPIPGGPSGRSIVPVPEPSALVLLGLAAMCLPPLLWRRKGR